MTHNDYKAKVDAEFERRIDEDNVPASKHLKVCNSITKKFYLQEDEETRDHLQCENNLTHDKMMAAHEAASKGLLPIDPSAQDK
jgi:hypothetical protein